MGDTARLRLSGIEAAFKEHYQTSLQDANRMFTLYRHTQYQFGISTLVYHHTTLIPDIKQRTLFFHLEPSQSDLLLPGERDIFVTPASIEKAWAGLQDVILNHERHGTVSIHNIDRTFGSIQCAEQGHRTLVLPPEFTTYHTRDRIDTDTEAFYAGQSRRILTADTPPRRVPFLQRDQ